MADPGGEALMTKAIDAGWTARKLAPPNPWVGAVVASSSGNLFLGATEPPGGRHAEVVALEAAGKEASGATLYVTLEPCSHTGRTGPCTEAIISSGISRVVVGLADPDENVNGKGIDRLRSAGVEVEVGLCEGLVANQLAPYLKHRTTGMPWVVLKLASTIDGAIATASGESKWITGAEARKSAHELRAESGAVIVGAGTVRCDDPELTVRHGVSGVHPTRVVLGEIPPGAKVLPAESMQGDLREILKRLGDRGIVQVLVEGGARTAYGFHSEGLVDRYVVYLAPAIFGGANHRVMFDGVGPSSMEGIWRGELVSVDLVGRDLRIELGRAG